MWPADRAGRRHGGGPLLAVSSFPRARVRGGRALSPIEATLKDGVLNLVLLKAETAKARTSELKPV
jgi:hypothetical protein